MAAAGCSEKWMTPSAASTSSRRIIISLRVKGVLSFMAYHYMTPPGSVNSGRTLKALHEPDKSALDALQPPSL